MKTIFKISGLFFMTLLLINCSNDDDNAGNSSQEFSPELLNGTWVISFFSDENEERTSEFGNYQFSFNVEEERVDVTNNFLFDSAAIEIFQENSLEDNPWVVYIEIGDLDDFGETDLSDLLEDWMVTNVNADATVIEFVELYSNNAPEILHLTKISD